MNPVGVRIVVVLGMHRSGTSLITRALQVLGVSLGERLMAPSDGNNAKGFFEDVDINQLNIALLNALDSDWQSIRPLEPADFDRLYCAGWVDKAIAVMRAKVASVAVFGFKDPRTAKLLPFWQEVFRVGRFNVQYLLALRNPASVADSLLSRDKLPRERSYYLWLEHMLNSLAGTVGCKPVLVNYDDFFGNADRVLEQMAAGLGLSVDAAERQEFSNAFIDAGLRHTVHSDADLLSDPCCPPLVAEVYQGLKDALRNKRGIDSLRLSKAMARWKAEFGRTGPALRLADLCAPAPAEAAPASAALEILMAIAQQDPTLLRSAFDQKWYCLAYADVAAAGIEPFEHYSQTGVRERRLPGPDVVQSAQRALAGLAGQRDDAAARLEQARRDEQRWADIMELQRSFNGRERSLAEQVQAVQQQLHASLERRAEREAAWVAREREAAQLAQKTARRHAAEVDSVRRAVEARELALAEQGQRAAAQARQLLDQADARTLAATEQRERIEAQMRELLGQAAAREAACAAALSAAQREQGERIAALTLLADQRHDEQQQQLAAARDRVEALLRQAVDQRARRSSARRLCWPSA